VRGRADRSYTELEYEAALAQGLPRLIFMVRADNPLVPSTGQPAEHGRRQEAFRSRLLEESNATAAWVATPSELELALLQALLILRYDPPASKVKHPNNLRHLRGDRWSQEEVAEQVGVTLNAYSSWERGERRPRPINMRALCKMFGVQERELGYDPPSGLDRTPDVAAEIVHEDVEATGGAGNPLLGAVVALPAAIQLSQAEWRRARRQLGTHGGELTRLAASLYPHAMKVERTPLLTREDWMTDDPIDMGRIRLDWLDGPQRKVISGAEAEARLHLPLRAPGRQFESITEAVRYLDRPAIFENRPTFRLHDVMMSDPNPRLSFSLATYFEMIDVSQAVAYELAAVEQSGREASLSRLAFRSLIGDPFDLRRRPAQAAVNAITIRRDVESGSVSFVLHWRDPAKVAVGGGLYSVMPVGVFQPSTVDPWGQRADFDLWRNMVREFSEEFLGTPEHDGSSGVQIDYDMWPLYRTLSTARDVGRLRVHCFGLGIDPLGLGIDLLTAVVIDSDVFDAVFGDLVQVNAEGQVVANTDPVTTVGVPFTEESVDRFLGTEPMGPGGAACLALAWRHRDALL
jgi:transcriptional regulator with XRE-family HTH domain